MSTDRESEQQHNEKAQQGSTAPSSGQSAAVSGVKRTGDASAASEFAAKKKPRLPGNKAAATQEDSSGSSTYSDDGIYVQAPSRNTAAAAPKSKATSKADAKLDEHINKMQHSVAKTNLKRTFASNKRTIVCPHSCCAVKTSFKRAAGCRHVLDTEAHRSCSRECTINKSVALSATLFSSHCNYFLMLRDSRCNAFVVICFFRVQSILKKGKAENVNGPSMEVTASQWTGVYDAEMSDVAADPAALAASSAPAAESTTVDESGDEVVSQSDADSDGISVGGSDSEADEQQLKGLVLVDSTNILRAFHAYLDCEEFRMDNRHLPDTEWDAMRSPIPVYPDQPLFAVRSYALKSEQIKKLTFKLNPILLNSKGRPMLHIAGAASPFPVYTLLLHASGIKRGDRVDASHRIGNLGDLDKTVINPRFMCYEKNIVNISRKFCTLSFEKFMKESQPSNGESIDAYVNRIMQLVRPSCELHHDPPCVLTSFPFEHTGKFDHLSKLHKVARHLRKRSTKREVQKNKETFSSEDKQTLVDEGYRDKVKEEGNLYCRYVACLKNKEKPHKAFASQANRDGHHRSHENQKQKCPLTPLKCKEFTNTPQSLYNHLKRKHSQVPLPLEVPD